MSDYKKKKKKKKKKKNFEKKKKNRLFMASHLVRDRSALTKT